MATALTNVYLYLGRRDKSGIRILARFQGRPQLPTRISELSDIILPNGWESQLNQIIYDSRMLWEPWIQSSSSYDELRAALKIRGYTNIPINSQPELLAAVSQTPIVNLSNLPKINTMIQKTV
jgi:hypothetical protein